MKKSSMASRCASFFLTSAVMISIAPFWCERNCTRHKPKASSACGSGSMWQDSKTSAMTTQWWRQPRRSHLDDPALILVAEGVPRDLLRLPLEVLQLVQALETRVELAWLDQPPLHLLQPLPELVLIRGEGGLSAPCATPLVRAFHKLEASDHFNQPGPLFQILLPHALHRQVNALLLLACNRLQALLKRSQDLSQAMTDLFRYRERRAAPAHQARVG